MSADDALLVDATRGARITGIGRSTFLTLVYAGEIESIKVGARRLIPVAAIQRWLEAKLAEQLAERGA